MDRKPRTAREIDAAIAELAERQHGVFGIAQAAGCGADAAHRWRRVQDRRWRQPYAGVFRLVGTAQIWEARVLAATLAGGPRGRASHRTAAALHGLPGGSRDDVEITCPRWRRARHDGLVIHESLRYDPDDTTVVESIPVTSVEVTLLDLGAVLRPERVEEAVDAALTRQLTTFAALRATLERLGRRGRDGTAALRAILDERAPTGRFAESPGETKLRRLLVRAGFPEPVLQHEVFTGAVFLARVDAAYPQWKIAIEYESYAHHTGRAALVRDSMRRNRLVAAGWTCFAVTAEDLRNGGLTVLPTIRAAIRAAP